MGVPFVPTLGYAGSDVIRERDDFTMAPNPFDPTEMVVMAKAITPTLRCSTEAKAIAGATYWSAKAGKP